MVGDRLKCTYVRSTHSDTKNSNIRIKYQENFTANILHGAQYSIEKEQATLSTLFSKEITVQYDDMINLVQYFEYCLINRE